MGGSLTLEGPSAEQLFLRVSVIDPVKVGNGVYMYTVRTETNMVEYDEPEKVVTRRYSDFCCLHDQLTKNYKGFFIPPLPEKNPIGKLLASVEFIQLRCKDLDGYLKKIASHPQLRHSKELCSFLKEISFFSQRPTDLGHMFKAMKLFITSPAKENPSEESHPDYEKLKHYIFELEDHLVEAGKQSFLLVKRHKELGETFLNFGRSMKAMGNCEGNLLGEAFNKLGVQSESISYKLQKQGNDLLMKFEEPIQEYARAVQSIKNAISIRAEAFTQHWELVELVKQKEIHLEKLRALQPEKAAKAQDDLRESIVERDAAKQEFEMIVKAMEHEMARFRKEMTHDLGTVLFNFAKGEAQLGNDIYKTWLSIVDEMDSSITDITCSHY